MLNSPISMPEHLQGAPHFAGTISLINMAVPERYLCACIP